MVPNPVWLVFSEEEEIWALKETPGARVCAHQGKTMWGRTQREGGRLHVQERPQSETNPAHTLTLDFWPPELWENKSVEFCFGRPSRLIHTLFYIKCMIASFFLIFKLVFSLFSLCLAPSLCPWLHPRSPCTTYLVGVLISLCTRVVRERHTRTEVRGYHCFTQLGSYLTGFQRLALHYSLKLMEKLQVRYKIPVHFFFFFETLIHLRWSCQRDAPSALNTLESASLSPLAGIVQKWWALPVGSYRWYSGSTHHCWWHAVWWPVKVVLPVSVLAQSLFFSL